MPLPKNFADNSLHLAEQLRKAIIKSGLSENQIAKGTGVPQPTLNRFMTGQRDIYLKTASKIAAYLGLELRKVSR